MHANFLIFRSDAKAVLAAMSKSQAIIEFDPSGKILTANENFCRTLGYDLGEIVGQYHRIFVDPAEAADEKYNTFWERLKGGDFDQRQYKRIGKGGKEIWIEASYNPVRKKGKVYKVVKFATDITDIKLKAAEQSGKLDALSRAQAIIEFTPAGDILTANENFLEALGYSASEIVGRHHSMFCEPVYVRSWEYGQFWDRLRAGEFIADEFARIGKSGEQVFTQASYNPIFDMNGNVFKIVKFATDVTNRVKNVEALGGCLQRLAGGDLTVNVEQAFIPSLDKLRVDFNEAILRLHAAMKHVGEKAGAIAVGSNEIRASADHLATRTEQQAASVEETAAALEQITTTVGDSSRRAEEAGRLVARTKENAEQSGQVVCEAIAAMDKIEQSASEISTIIGVIDEIAFQTNILALNAGIEAARAGDAGRGFAVVAQEVRQLAHRSTEAAKQIKTLIGTSGQQVRSGADLVGQTGQVLHKIVKQVAEINTNVSAIAEGAREQATALKEINQAVNSLDQGTQQNAAMVEETTAASHGLATEAGSLFTLVGQFRMHEGTKREDLHLVKHEQEPVRSPARQLADKLIRSIGGGASAATNRDDWQEF